MRKVLWLASWYPNRTDKFHGDFIERHALAVSRLMPLTVMFVVKDPLLGANETAIEKDVIGNLTVYSGYYGPSKFSDVLEQVLSSIKYFRLQKKIYRQVVADTGIPALVHVHVAMKAGMLALWLLQKFGIKFIVTEHWTGYYPEAKPSIYASNFIFRFLNKRVLEKAALILPVSNDLGKTICTNIVQADYRVLPNTVDCSLFFYKTTTAEMFRFIHPSYMNYQKNPDGILKSCKMVKDQGYDFELLMVGNKDQRLESVAAAYGLSANILFKPAIPYREVAVEMQASAALLLFSRFENLPCVVLEAFCCGLPVISSRVGGIAEVVNEDNGILVESENEGALAGAMIKMMKAYEGYNRREIAGKASAMFNYDEIGQQHLNIYDNL